MPPPPMRSLRSSHCRIQARHKCAVFTALLLPLCYFWMRRTLLLVHTPFVAGRLAGSQVDVSWREIIDRGV
jgi:hypothetical protein